MASAQRFDVEITGSQTHGARPWAGVDPIVVGAQIVNGFTTIVSRQIDITQHPVVVTVGQFEAGVRNNIVPETATLSGTIRTFDPNVRAQVHEKIQRVVTQVAQSQGATATLEIDPGVPVTFNDAALTARLAPTLEDVYGQSQVSQPVLITGAEDFLSFRNKSPAFSFSSAGARRMFRLRSYSQSLSVLLCGRRRTAAWRSRHVTFGSGLFARGGRLADP